MTDARALIAVNDMEGAIKSYKLAVMENVDDPLVRREYIDFMKEQGDLEEWLELEQTFLKAFPSVENFESYDKSVYDLVLQINAESARILSEGGGGGGAILRDIRASAESSKNCSSYLVQRCSI